MGVKRSFKFLASLLSHIEAWILAIIHPPRLTDRRVEKWEQHGELPLSFVAIIYLAVFSIPIIYPNGPHYLLTTCDMMADLIWVVFGVDYLIRLLLAHHRWAFIRYNLLDLLIVILPFFGPLRLLRLVFLLRVLNRRATNSMRGKITSYAIFSAFLLLYVGALAVLAAERGAPDSQINSFGTALWWALVTMTTVGYGDVVPITTEGKIVACTLMIFGVGLIGVVTATLASLMVEKVDETEENINENFNIQVAQLLEVNQQQNQQLNTLMNQNEELKAKLTELTVLKTDD